MIVLEKVQVSVASSAQSVNFAELGTWKWIRTILRWYKETPSARWRWRSRAALRLSNQTAGNIWPFVFQMEFCSNGFDKHWCPKKKKKPKGWWKSSEWGASWWFPEAPFSFFLPWQQLETFYCGVSGGSRAGGSLSDDDWEIPHPQRINTFQILRLAVKILVWTEPRSRKITQADVWICFPTMSHCSSFLFIAIESCQF